MRRDYYQVLGIARDASPAGIRAAYARLARLHHPDQVGKLTTRLADIQEAYRCLSNPVARAAHDQAVAMAGRLHVERQERVRQRLRRYDRRHPRLPHRAYWRWRRLTWAVGGLTLLTGLLVMSFS